MYVHHINALWSGQSYYFSILRGWKVPVVFTEELMFLYVRMEKNNLALSV